MGSNSQCMQTLYHAEKVQHVMHSVLDNSSTLWVLGLEVRISTSGLGGATKMSLCICA